MFDRVTAFGCETTLVETRNVSKLASSISDLNGQSVLFCNVHMLMLANEDPLLANAMSAADIVFADGVPIAWLQQKLTGKPAQVIRGYEMMGAICERAAKLGENVGFFGSTKEVMQCLTKNLEDRFEGLQATYRFCPPFMEDQITTSPSELMKINNSDIKWLFVGLGCPKQEKWIAQYKNDLDCNILGVGAAFDWLAGTAKKPPEWMEKYALAWLYRLFQSPARMWRRYLVFNSKFIFRALPLLLRRR